MLREEILKRIDDAEKALKTAQLSMGIITGITTSTLYKDDNCRHFVSLASQVLTDTTTALKHFNKFKKYQEERFIDSKFLE